MRYYTGKCDKCNSVVAGLVDLPNTKKDTAKNLQEWIKEGLIVESFEGEYGPKLNGCKCKKQEKTFDIPLFV